MAKNNNYFQMMINQHGEDWVAAVRPEDIQRSSKKIVKDMIRGNIEYEKYGKYFLDPKFIENLYIALNNELEINVMNNTACKFYYSYFPQTPNIGVHIQNLDNVIYVYNTIVQKLDYVRSSGNIGYLTDISGMLFNYRNYIV